MTESNWRELCRELVSSRGANFYAALERARAALAQPELTDEELKAAYWKAFQEAPIRDAEAIWLSGLRAAAHAAIAADRARFGRPASEPEPVGPTDEELDSLERQHWEETGVEEHIRGWRERIFNHRAYARAVLARWGRPAPVPAEGDVGELVALIRQIALAWEPDACLLGNMTAGQLARAADLLEQRQAAPVPVAVSERLPQPEDCDAEGRCWWWYPPVPEQNYGYWIFEDNAVPERSRLEWPESWLPAYALPLPSGEVEA